MKLEEQIKRVIEERLHVKIRHDSETLFDMGADSLDIIELADKLEEVFGIKIKDEDLSTDLTVGDVIKFVKEELK